MTSRSNEAKKLSVAINIKPLTSLQKLMISPEFDAAIILVIIANCIVMASESPVLETSPLYVVVSNYIFNIIFILELVLQIAAFGVLPYFSDYWHWLDAIVVATSLLDLIVAILKALSGVVRGISFTINTKVLRVLRVVRFFRILRPLKTIRYFKGVLVFVESLALSVDILLITTGIFVTTMVALAFLTNSFVGDLLLNRCVPITEIIGGIRDLPSNSTARSDVNYIAYGVEYFYSSYNLEYCRNSRSCPLEYDCVRANVNAFAGVPGDYSTPWHALRSNLAFITLRGWPLIFTAISNGYDTIYAYFVLFATILLCPLFLLNMFPAIFIISLKRCEDVQLRLDWLAHYPGDKETVTELDLFVWANANQSLFFRLQNNKSVNPITQCLNCFAYCYKGIASMGKRKKNPLTIENNNNNSNETSNDKDNNDNKINFDNNNIDDADGKDDKNEDKNEDEKDQKDNLGIENDVGETDKETLCVPKGRSMAALRSLFTVETSPFASFINVVIVLNILSLAADAQSTPDKGRESILYLNYAFIAIFLFEVVIKIILLGPCLYLDNPFNLLDFSLVILSIPTYASSSFQVTGTLRILRLARLAKLGQMDRLENQLNPTAGKISKIRTRIDLGRLSGMIFDLTSPMINNIMLLFILMYIYAIVGMQFFASPNAPRYELADFSLKYRFPLGTPTNATAVDVGSIFSAGIYLHRMNFNCFGNAIVTVFNIGVLNGWYLFMTNTVRLQKSEGAVWYFFSYVYFVVFLLGSTLIASVVSALDQHAKAMVRDIAAANKAVLERYVVLNRRQRLRKYFRRLKRNTSDEGEGAVQPAGAIQKLKREPVRDGFEEGPVESYLTKVMRERSDYSLYLFSRKSYFRRFMVFVVENIIFQLVVTFAVLVSVLAVVSNAPPLMGPLNERVFIVVVFLVEMGSLWLAYGIYGAPNAYLNQPLYLIDFFVNIAMLIAFYTDLEVLNQLRLFRMLKLPNLMLYITSSNKLKIFFIVLFEAIPSITSVVNLSLAVIFLAGVVGVQLYTGAFSSCSSNLFPATRSRFATDPIQFPTGCLGTGYDNRGVNMTSAVFSSTTGYGLGTVLTNLHWKIKMDNFDSIFTACKSTLRVIMSNEWQGILFTALDVVGVDFQPKTNFHRASGAGSFIFLFILSLFGITLGALYVSIFYYHYLITCILTGRKSLIGRQDAMWAMYEEKLILVRPSIVLAGNRWAALARFYRRLDVRFLIISYCFIPIILLIGFYHDPAYTDKDFIFYDTIFSCLYVIEYSVRGISDFTLEHGISGIYKSTNFQEGAIVLFLIAVIILNGNALSRGRTLPFLSIGNTRDIEYVCACSLLRVYRLAILFPNASRVLAVMRQSLTGFFTLCVYALIIILIFGLLGYDVMKNLKPEYGSKFLNESLNFQTIQSSWLTLLSIGTGNYYSEILNALKRETGKNLGLQVFMEIYFLLFYLFFFLILKSFAIQIIIRYENLFGASLGIAGEQISAFQYAWKKAGLFDKVKYDKLPSLIGKHLPPPLGLAGTNPKYLELSRFMKKILLCMPAEAFRCDDMDVSGKTSRFLFAASNLPNDIRNKNELWDPSKFKFSFRQILVAVHKRALYDMVLADEVAANAARAIHRSRLDDIVIFLARLTLARYEQHQIPFKAMLLMQRIKPETYKSFFCSIIRAQLHKLRLKIHVFGFSPFDAFIVATLREAIHLESKASNLQLEVKKKLETAAHHSRHSVEALNNAKKYNMNVKGFNKIVDELYESNMETVWDLGSLDVYAIGREKRAVTAVAIDYTGKIYVALNMGLLKIYKTRDQPNLPLRLVQKLNMKARIRSLVVSMDGKKIFLGCGDKVIILVLSSSRKRLNFKELLSFTGHSAPVNVVLQFNRFVLSGGQDRMIYLWRLNSKEPGNSYDAGSPVFCMCILPLKEDNVAVDEVALTDILVCGTAKGKLLILPLPLANSNESETWNGTTIDAGESGVSSLRIAWDFIYAGFTDGRVRTWAVESKKSTNVITNPIKMIQLLPVQSVQVHAGPVTCLAYTGGALFSASYDFSILPWTTPDRLNAKTMANFSQSYREGLVYHSNCIISIDSNKSMMVTGDEGGRIVVTYPKKIREDFMSSGTDKKSNVKSQPSFNFSFIEYDFKKCFLNNNGGVIEEEVILNIQNFSGSAATIRCLLKKHSCFHVDLCENENRNNGCEVVSLLSPGSTNIKIATMFDNLHTVQYRIVFHPIESRAVYLPIEFLINEKEIVKVQVRGSGIKSKLHFNSVKLYEMGTVGIGQYGVEKINIENKEDRPILVNCLTECEDKIENKNYEISTVRHNLASKYVSVIPRCFSIPPRGQVELLIRFTPPIKMDVFKMPVRAIYGGGEGTLAEIRVRSADPPGSVTKDIVAPHGKRLSITNSVSSSGDISQLSKISKKAKNYGKTKFGKMSLNGIVEEKEGEEDGDRDLEMGEVGDENRLMIDTVEEDDGFSDLISENGVFNEAKALKFLYKGLRKLSPSETPCPGDLLNGLLQEIGWSLAIEGQLALLYHDESGLFIEIPNSRDSSLVSRLSNDKNIKKTKNDNTNVNVAIPLPLSSVNEFQIDFMCDEASSYELWYGERLIRSGTGEQDIMESIYVHATDLYHVTDRFGAAIPTPIPYVPTKRNKNNIDYIKENINFNEDSNDNDDTRTFQSASSGTQLLILMVFARDSSDISVPKENINTDRKPLCSNVSTQPDGRVLLHTTYVKVLKGFRLGILQTDDENENENENEDDDGIQDLGSLQLEERIAIAGIVRVVTYMDRDLGTLTEIFEKEIDLGPVPQGPVLHKKNIPIGGEPVEDLFSRAILHINTLQGAKKHDFIPDKTSNSSKNDNSNNTEINTANVADVPTHVRVVDRAVALDLSDLLESTVVENMVDILEIATTSSGIKEILLEKPVLTGDINRHRSSRAVVIEVLVMPVLDGGDDLREVEVLASATVSGHIGRHLKSEQFEYPFDITYSSLPHLVQSHRHGVYLKVVTPKDEPPSRVRHLSSLINSIKSNKGTKYLKGNSIFNGQWYFVIDRNSLKLVSSSIIDPLETVDLTFLTRGFVAEFRKEYHRCTAVMDGRYVDSRGVDELPKQMKLILSKLQLSNNHGYSSQFTSAPLFLREKWGEFVKHSLHRKVIRAMTSLVEKTRIIAAAKAAQEAAMIIKEYESTAATAASSDGKKVARKNADAYKKKEAEDKAKNILDSILPTSDITFHDVYADMTKITHDFYTSQQAIDEKKIIKNDDEKNVSGQKFLPSSILNKNYLSYYLQKEILAGFDNPLSITQCGIVLESLESNHQTNAVKVDQFGDWYKSDEEKVLRNELRDKKVFSYLLEEERQKDDVLDGTNIKHKIVRGTAAKKMINDMHLMGDNIKWKKQEKEIEKSNFYNDGDEENNNFNSHLTSRKDADPSTLRKTKSKKFNITDQPKKLMNSLTGFMKNMNARRFLRSAQKAVVADEPKLNNIEGGSDGEIDGVADSAVIGGSRPKDSMIDDRNRMRKNKLSDDQDRDSEGTNRLVAAILGSQKGSELSEIDYVHNKKIKRNGSQSDDDDDEDSDDDDEDGNVSDSSYEFSEASDYGGNEYNDVSDDESDSNRSNISESDVEDDTEQWEEDMDEDQNDSRYPQHPVHSKASSPTQKNNDSSSEWSQASDSRSGSGSDDKIVHEKSKNYGKDRTVDSTFSL